MKFNVKEAQWRAKSCCHCVQFGGGSTSFRDYTNPTSPVGTGEYRDCAGNQLKPTQLCQVPRLKGFVYIKTKSALRICSIILPKSPICKLLMGEESYLFREETSQ